MMFSKENNILIIDNLIVWQPLKDKGIQKEPATHESGWLFLYNVGDVLEIYAIIKIRQRDT